MTQIKTTLLAALLFAASACAGSDNAPMHPEGANEGAALPTIVIVDLPSNDTPPSLANPFEDVSQELGFTTELDAQMVEDYGDICECSTQECLDLWVEQTIGCDVCVFVECDGTRRDGVCVTCD